MRVQASPEGTGGALRALAVMGDEAVVVWRTLSANRPPYRVDRGLLGDAPGHRPAHDLAGEGACRGREVGPPFSRGMHAMPPARSLLRPPAAKARSARFNRGPSGLAFFWMRRFRVAPLPASPGFRMMRSTRFSLTTMPLFRSSRSMRRQPPRP